MVTRPIPDAEFAEKIDATRRRLGNLDREGCPFVTIAGRKYRPLNEALNWFSSRIQCQNPAPLSRKTERAAMRPLLQNAAIEGRRLHFGVKLRGQVLETTVSPGSSPSASTTLTG